MKTFTQLLAILTITTAGLVTQAAEKISTANCEESHARLNAVYEMKTYSNGGIKVFALDNIEPGAVPFALAITIDRGEDLSTYESFCRYIPYLSSVDSLSKMKSNYDSKTNTLSLSIAVKRLNGDGDFVAKTLSIKINKAAKTEADLVKAEVN